MTSPSPELAAILVRIGDLTGRAAMPSALSAELTRAAAGVRRLLSASACSVALVEADGETLRFVAADGAGADEIAGVTMSASRGIAGWVVMSGQAIAVADVQADSRFARDIAESTDYVPQSMLAVPLVDDHGSILGVMEVLDPDAGSTDTGHLLDVLATVGDQVSSIVRLAQVYDQLGGSLLQALAGGTDRESFGDVLRELAGPDDDGQLAALAATFNDLAARGPEAADLAQRILREVASYARDNG